MNEQLQSKLVEILAGIQAATKTAGDFAMEQLPDIAQQYLIYGRAYATAYVVIALAIALGGFWVLSAARGRHAKADAEFSADMAKYDEQMKIPHAYPSRPYRSSYFEMKELGPLPYVPFAISAVIFVLNMSQFFLVWFAPKVWLLKELASLIK